MKLIVHEIETAAGVWQELTTPEKIVQVYAVRPHIYKHNNPAGNLKVQIEDETGQLIAESEEVSVSSISDADFFHGYVRFYISAQLSPSTKYRFKVVGATNYSFTEEAFAGVCNAFDLAKYESSYPQPVGYSAPIDFEIWTKENR